MTMTTAPDLWRRFPIEPDTEDLACMATSNVLAPLPARQNAVKKNARQHVAGGLIEVLILDSLARQRTDLGTEIGIMLRSGPDSEDEMLGIDRPDPPLPDPGLDNAGLHLDEVVQVAGQSRVQMRRTLQHLHGEEARSCRMAAGIVELSRDIGAQRHSGVAQGIEFLQRFQPHVESSPKHGGVEGFLGSEVIKQVGLRQSRDRRDLVDPRPLKAISRKNLKSRIENALRVRLAGPSLSRGWTSAHPNLVSQSSTLSCSSCKRPYVATVPSGKTIAKTMNLGAMASAF